MRARLFECHDADGKGSVNDFETAKLRAVCRRACNQIERKTIPNYCKLFNEFCPWDLRLTLDAERAGERKFSKCSEF